MVEVLPSLLLGCEVDNNQYAGQKTLNITLVQLLWGHSTVITFEKVRVGLAETISKPKSKIKIQP